VPRSAAAVDSGSGVPAARSVREEFYAAASAGASDLSLI
jgi:hypothetical protein